MPFDTTFKDDYNRQATYLIENGQYGDIYYDPYKNIYYRFLSVNY